MTLKELRSEAKWFLENTGEKGLPFIRNYLRHSINETLKTHTKEEVENELTSVAQAVARELGFDWKGL